MAATSSDKPKPFRVFISSLWSALKTFSIEVRNAAKLVITPQSNTDKPARLYGFVHNLEEQAMYIAVKQDGRTNGELVRDINEYQTWVGPVHASLGYSDLEHMIRDSLAKHPEGVWSVFELTLVAQTMKSPVSFTNVKK